MSGHSKWSSIKHQKAVSDKRRANLFTKLGNAISVAARSGGDPEMNYQLRLAIDKAKAANMPRENIERAIKRGTGQLPGVQIEEATYEIYGPFGTAVLVKVLTDNKNRTLAQIKSVLNKFGGKLAGSGAVSYLFERKGEIKIDLEGQGIGGQNANLGSEEIELKIIDSGADDYQKIPASPAGGEGGYLIYTRPETLKDVADALKQNGLKVESTELVFQPKNTIDLPEAESKKVVDFLEALDDLDEVTEVNSNLG
jgi:YebC/PmpR family DNA-binding regulatory protein